MITSAVAILLLFFPGTSHALPEGDYRHQEKADVLYRTLAGWPQNTFDFHNGVYYRYVDSGGSPSNPNDSALHNAFEMTGITGTQGAFPNTIVTSTGGISEITVQTFKNPSGGSAQYWGAYTLTYTSIPRGLAASASSTRSALIVTAKNLKNRTPTPINYSLSPGQKVVPNIYYNYIGTGTATGSLLEIDEIEFMRSDAFTEYCYAANALQIVPYASIYELSGAQYLQRLAAYGGLSPRRQFERLRASSIEAPSITVYNGTTTVADGGATYLTSLNVRVDDGLSGPERLEFYRDGSTVAVVNLNDTQRQTTSYTYTSGDIAELGSLQNAAYRVRAIDQAGNETSSSFNVSSNQAGSSMNNAGGQPLPSTHGSNYCEIMTSSESIAGIQSITRQSATTSATAPFDCVPVATYGPFCNQSAGNYTWTMQTCAGMTSSTTTTVQSAAAFMITEDASSAETTITEAQAMMPGAVLRLDVCGPPMSNCTVCTADRYAEISLSGAGPFCGSPGGGGGSSCCMGIVLSDVVSTAYTVTNTTQTSPNFELTASARVVKTGEGAFTVVVTTVANYTGNTSGNITVAEFGQPSCVSTPGADRQVCAPASGVTTSTAPCTGLISMLIHSLFPPITCTEVHGSEIVYTSSASIAMSFSSGAGGVATDTTTLAIFQFTGTQWSSATVTDQTISSNSGTITLTGNFARTGLFGAFFVATDTTPPVTSFVIQGSSYSFDGTIFVSTDAYAVLTATDPVVNGFASTVATITYRLDPSSGTAYSVYASSIPLPLGTHVFEYRSHDYAGNVEAVKTATFTVTAGTAFRNSGSLQVAGSLLNGFLGSGARLEIESQAQNNLTLLVSSVNRQGMVAVDNIGEVGIGVTPQANLDIGAAPIALQLRSGNSTSSVTSAQIAFAYNGDGSYRHFLRTEHSTSTDGNKLDFLVWNPSAGSTTTLASLNVLSLQGIASASGGSFHVNPAGEPDAEVEVSNGAATGGGTIQYGELVAPSSRRFKTDIKDLSEKDEARALADVAALKHVRFRYLNDDPKQPLHTGLIYEEVPDSLRGADGTLSAVERLANVEMALKASMAKLEKLQKRYAELKKRGKP